MAVNTKRKRSAFTLSFNVERNKWEIRNALNKNLLFSFDSEERAIKLIESFENYPLQYEY